MTILCYHSVDPAWESPLAVRPVEFERHCAWLARRRRVVPLLEAVRLLDGSGRLPRRMAVLTFDDGFSGVRDFALPIITRYRLPATVFLVAQTLTPAGQEVDWVNNPPPWPLKTLTRDEVQELQAAGVNFQSHSWAHVDLPRLGFDACVKDLRDSRELLEDVLSHQVPLLAYPRGRHDEEVQRAAARAGYTHAFGLPEHSEDAGPYSLPRVGIHRGNGVQTLRVKCARPYLPLRHGKTVRALRSVGRR